MGIGPFSGNSYSSYDMVEPKFTNPNPSNFIILSHWEIGKYLVVHIRYPDCTNFEGLKILVYENCSLKMLKEQATIDPHFSANTMFHSPIARFIPNDHGLQMALSFVRMMNASKKEEL